MLFAIFSCYIIVLYLCRATPCASWYHCRPRVKFVVEKYIRFSLTHHRGVLASWHRCRRRRRRCDCGKREGCSSLGWVFYLPVHRLPTRETHRTRDRKPTKRSESSCLLFVRCCREVGASVKLLFDCGRYSGKSAAVHSQRDKHALDKEALAV